MSTTLLLWLNFMLDFSFPPRPTMITTDPLYFRSRSAIDLITNNSKSLPKL